MSLSNISTSLPSVEKFIQRTSAAEKSQQKEIRITIQEARELTTELASMTAKLGKTVQEIHQLLVEIRDSTTKIDVKFDGGGFGS
jgi:ABC-type transporter Mla subunit MlaD